MRVLPFFVDNEPGGLLFTVPCTSAARHPASKIAVSGGIILKIGVLVLFICVTIYTEVFM